MKVIYKNWYRCPLLIAKIKQQQGINQVLKVIFTQMHYQQMDSFIQEKQDENPRAYSIISTSDQPIVYTNQAMVKMNLIIKQLNEVLLVIPICQNNFRDLTAEERSIITAIRKDQSLSNLFAGVLGFDYVIRYYFQALHKIHEQIIQSFSQFAQGYTKIREQINVVNQQMLNMDKKFNDLEGRIKTLTYLQIQKQSQPTMDENSNNYKLLNQNRILKQNIKKLEIKYKHVLLEQKNFKEKDIRSSTSEECGEDHYGFRRPGYQPMRISVEILQRRLKQAQKQIMMLKKKGQFDFMRLIQQLERQIQILRIQKNQNLKTIAQLTNKIYPTNTYTPYYNTVKNQESYYQNNLRSSKIRIRASRQTNIDNILQKKRNSYYYPDHQQLNTKNQQSEDGQNNNRGRQKSVPLNIRAKNYQ